MSIYDIEVKDIYMKTIKMEEFKGKTLLIVNVASACGFTPQYTGLQNLYDRYKDKGLEILAFPCNQFGAQEKGTNEEIKDFCDTKYNVSFRLLIRLMLMETMHHLFLLSLLKQLAERYSGILQSF